MDSSVLGETTGAPGKTASGAGVVSGECLVAHSVNGSAALSSSASDLPGWGAPHLLPGVPMSTLLRVTDAVSTGTPLGAATSPATTVVPLSALSLSSRATTSPRMYTSGAAGTSGGSPVPSHSSATDSSGSAPAVAANATLSAADVHDSFSPSRSGATVISPTGTRARSSMSVSTTLYPPLSSAGAAHTLGHSDSFPSTTTTAPVAASASAFAPAGAASTAVYGPACPPPPSAPAQTPTRGPVLSPSASPSPSPASSRDVDAHADAPADTGADAGVDATVSASQSVGDSDDGRFVYMDPDADADAGADADGYDGNGGYDCGFGGANDDADNDAVAAYGRPRARFAAAPVYAAADSAFAESANAEFDDDHALAFGAAASAVLTAAAARAAAGSGTRHNSVGARPTLSPTASGGSFRCSGTGAGGSSLFSVSSGSVATNPASPSGGPGAVARIPHAAAVFQQELHATVTRWERKVSVPGSDEYVAYEIAVVKPPLRWAVWRRYSEFRTLNAGLCKLPELRGVRLPDLPRRKVFGSLRDAFIEKRKAQLTVYWDEIMLLVDKLGSSMPFLSFIGALKVPEKSAVLAGVEDRAVRLDTLQVIAKEGDVVLFKTAGVLQRLHRGLLSTDYDHVGIVIRIPEFSTSPASLFLLEATTDGVLSYPLRRRLLAWSSCGAHLAYRPLRMTRTRTTATALADFVALNDGKPYSFTPAKLLRRTSTVDENGETEAFFCSELVASALKSIGALVDTRPSSSYLPASFAANASSPLVMAEGCYLDNEVLIEVKSPEIFFAKDISVRGGGVYNGAVGTRAAAAGQRARPPPVPLTPSSSAAMAAAAAAGGRRSFGGPDAAFSAGLGAGAAAGASSDSWLSQSPDSTADALSTPSPRPAACAAAGASALSDADTLPLARVATGVSAGVNSAAGPARSGNGYYAVRSSPRLGTRASPAPAVTPAPGVTGYASPASVSASASASAAGAGMKAFTVVAGALVAPLSLSLSVTASSVSDHTATTQPQLQQQQQTSPQQSRPPASPLHPAMSVACGLESPVSVLRPYSPAAGPGHAYGGTEPAGAAHGVARSRSQSIRRPPSAAALSPADAELAARMRAYYGRDNRGRRGNHGSAGDDDGSVAEPEGEIVSSGSCSDGAAAGADSDSDGDGDGDSAVDAGAADQNADTGAVRTLDAARVAGLGYGLAYEGGSDGDEDDSCRDDDDDGSGGEADGAGLCIVGAGTGDSSSDDGVDDDCSQAMEGDRGSLSRTPSAESSRAVAGVPGRSRLAPRTQSTTAAGGQRSLSRSGSSLNSRAASRAGSAAGSTTGSVKDSRSGSGGRSRASPRLPARPVLSRHASAVSISTMAAAARADLSEAPGSAAPQQQPWSLGTEEALPKLVASPENESELVIGRWKGI